MVHKLERACLGSTLLESAQSERDVIGQRKNCFLRTSITTRLSCKAKSREKNNVPRKIGKWEKTGAKLLTMCFLCDRCASEYLYTATLYARCRGEKKKNALILVRIYKNRRVSVKASSPVLRDGRARASASHKFVSGQSVQNVTGGQFHGG